MNTKVTTRKKTGNARERVKMLIAAVLVIVTVAGGAISVCAASYPKPDNFVADAAGILSEGTVRTIRNSNETMEKDIGAVIAVCTVSTTGETPIGEYARAVFRDWKLGESILILIAVDDMNYYFLQSAGIDDHITNEELEEITKNYLEDDFVADHTDTGVMKVVSKLSDLLRDRVPKAVAEQDSKAEKSGSKVGRVIGGFFKAILFIALFAVAAFVILFIVAMFNDDVAKLMQKYIFRRNTQKNVPSFGYDERLYGNGQHRQQNGQGMRGQNQTDALRSYSENRQNMSRDRQYNDSYSGYTGYDNYRSQTQTGEEPFYNSDGTRRR